MNLQNIWRTKYGEEIQKKPDREAIMEKRLEKYGNLCQLGIANLFWKGTTLVFKDMNDNHDPNLLTNIVLFTFCLLCMAMGTVAAMFPDTSPCPCFMAGFGALLAIISMFGSYHLDLLAYFPSAFWCCISMVLTSTAFTIYWAYAVQDPWIIHLLARLLNALWGLLGHIWNKVTGWIGEKGGPMVNKMKDFCGSRKGKQGTTKPLLGRNK